MDCKDYTLSISEVSEKTGVNPVTLRAWQRRYGLLKPQRTPKGHRLFSEQDVERIKSILGWLDKGVAISKVKALLEQGVAPASEADFAPVETLKDIILTLNANKLRKEIDALLREYPFYWLVDNLLIPIQEWLTTLESPLADLHQDIWQSLVIEQCQVVLSGSAKRGGKKSCWIVPVGETSLYQRIILAMLMHNKGYSVTIIHQPQFSFRYLREVFSEQGVDCIALCSENKLTRGMITEFNLWDRENLAVVLEPHLYAIHHTDINNVTEVNAL